MQWVALLPLLAATLAGCISTSSKSSKINPSELSELYVRKGIQYMEHGYSEYALQDLTHALEINANNANGHSAIGLLYQRIQQPAKAQEHFERALQLDPDSPTTLNNYGQFLCERGNYAEAQARFQKAANNPLYSRPWIAWTNAAHCARLAAKYTEAEGYIRQSLEKNPQYAVALYEGAAVAYALNNFLSARGFLQRYEEVASHAPTSLLLAVQIENALGNPDGVRRYLQQLNRQFPDSKEAAAARQHYVPGGF